MVNTPTRLSVNGIVNAVTSVLNGKTSASFPVIKQRRASDPKPTIAALSPNGTSPPTPTLNIIATDSGGFVNFGTGTAPASGSQVRVTFGTAFAQPPCVIFTKRTSFAVDYFLANVTSTSFDVAFGSAPGASLPNGTFQIEYACFDYAV
jgi:hypothetical protein